MRAHLPLIVAVVVFSSGGSRATVLYTLVSPNEENTGRFGTEVSGAGDINNDDRADVIVGAPSESPGVSPIGAGRAYVFSGASGSVIYALQSPNEEAYGGFGESVSGAGDVNNDEYNDLIVGASQEEPGSVLENWGRAYIFSGSTGGLLRTLESPNPFDEGRFGGCVSDAGDLNNDGYAEVVVGAPGEANHGRAYIFNGQTGSVMYTLDTPNPELDGMFGCSVSCAGDVNNDDHPDVIVGAHNEDPDASPTDAGRAYVFSGANGSLLYSLQSPNEQYEGWFGVSVSGAGNVDGNNFDDIIVGACREGLGDQTEMGRAYIFAGLAGVLLRTLESPNLDPYGWFGGSVSGAGDVNANGRDDVIVGASLDDPSGIPTDAGRAYVFSGSSGYLLQTLVSPNQEAGGVFGNSVSGAGDQDGDGRAEVIVGAPGEDPGASPDYAGRAYVIVPTPRLAIEGVISGSEFQLTWSPWEGATSYWVCGADNLPHFQPGVGLPYPYRVAIVPAGTTTWSSSQGVFNPDHNWTYLVMAIHSFPEEELTRSDRCGEFDFTYQVP